MLAACESHHRHHGIQDLLVQSRRALFREQLRADPLELAGAVEFMCESSLALA
ncbi:hypothetical protein ACRAWG_15160 [Methylobacterium sp. P31]